MINKRTLASRIWAEVVDMHRRSPSEREPRKGFPQMIPCGDGKSIIISDQAASDISSFSRLVHENDPALRVALGGSDIGEVIRRAFGSALVKIDLEADPDEASQQLLTSVGETIAIELDAERPEKFYVFGCWLIRDEFVGDIVFGPVRFERRERFLNRMRDERRIPEFIHRRLLARWAGRTPRPLKNHYNRIKEESFTDALGNCPVVCTVSSEGLATGAGRQKAVLAARLAMMAMALLWERPAKALEGFALLIDGEAQAYSYLVLGEPGAWTSVNGSKKLIGTTWIPEDDWKRLWADHTWLTSPVGELLFALLYPGCVARKPKINRTLTHALWWFYEGCRAEAPLMAAAKFGTCLDILAGGTSVGKILQLVKARCGSGPDDRITRDGRTTREVVNTIYGAARSQTMHGSNERYNNDWTGTRDLAEHMTRRCFVEVLSWLEDNPTATDLAGALIEKAE